MEVNQTDSMDLIEVLSSIAPLSAGYHQRLSSQMVTERYPARYLLLQPGEICRRIYFIKKGIVRIYHIDELGKERTLTFMGMGELAVDANSFYEQRPATEYLETLQETVIQSLSWQELNSMYADFAEGNYIGRIVTQRYLMIAVRRNTELLTANLQERYDSLLERFPNIEQQANQSHIASYLNITRETLYRLRSERLRMKN